MTSFRRRYDVYATSHILCIDVETTSSVYGDATLQSNKLRQNYFSRILSNAAEQLYCRKVLKNIYFVFCILYNACQRLLLVDTNTKILIVSHSTSWVLQCTAAQSKDLLKIININLALTIESSFVCSWGQKGIYIPNWWFLAVF